MRKSKKFRYKVYNGRLIKERFENSRIYMLAVMFVAGILIGAISIKNTDSAIINELCTIVDGYKSMRQNIGFISNLTSSLSVSLSFCLFSVFLGFSLIGYPFLLWVPLARGLAIGTVCGYLYSAYKLSGLGFAVLTLYPGAIISVTALIISCNESCTYSKNAYQKAIGSKGQFERGETKLFLLRQTICLAACAFSSLIDATVAKAFSNIFTF